MAGTSSSGTSRADSASRARKVKGQNAGAASGGCTENRWRTALQTVMVKGDYFYIPWSRDGTIPYRYFQEILRARSCLIRVFASGDRTASNAGASVSIELPIARDTPWMNSSWLARRRQNTHQDKWIRMAARRQKDSGCSCCSERSFAIRLQVIGCHFLACGRRPASRPPSLLTEPVVIQAVSQFGPRPVEHDPKISRSDPQNLTRFLRLQAV